MNVEVVQRRLWEQSQQHRKQDQPQWIVTACNRVLSLYPIKAVWKAGCSESCTSGLGLGREAQLLPPTPPGWVTTQAHPAEPAI